ncbi:MAG: PHB depolymerase family esterase [Chloroflexota bacterium]
MRTFRMSLAGALVLVLLTGFGHGSAAQASDEGDGDPLSRPPIPSAGCGSSAVEPGLQRGYMEVAGVERTWQLQVPPVHDGQTPLPLVIGLHGGMESVSSNLLLALAREEGFVAVAPRDAYQDFWMMWEPHLPGYDLSLGNPDIALVDALIDQLGEELCLDLARVYATGFSIGASGTSVLGCVLDDRLAAVAPVGGAADLGETCNPERPVPVLAIHGLEDADARYDGSVADWFLDTVLKDGSRVRDSGWGQWLMSEGDLSIPDSLTATAVRYGCAPEPVVEPLGEADHYVWVCPTDAAVELVAHDGGHTWSSNTDGRTTEQLIWDFFEQHPMPE